MLLRIEFETTCILIQNLRQISAGFLISKLLLVRDSFFEVTAQSLYCDQYPNQYRRRQARGL